MNIAGAATEILNWVGSHPIDDALCCAALTFIGIGVEGKYNGQREKRHAMKEILGQLPRVGHVEVTRDKTLKSYDADGKLKYILPFTPPQNTL